MNRWIRLLKHQWMDTDDTRHAVPDDMAQRLAQRIAASETHHTGELRLCVEAALPWPDLLSASDDERLRQLIRERALHWFAHLRVWDTEHNNGVLIYLLLAERAIEVVADRALSHRISPEQWAQMVRVLSEQLRQGSLEEGLSQALDAVSRLLCEQFPAARGHVRLNELSDNVVRC